ncbi:hypothetical protein [Pantanalinema sp. GBBB05]|uniref:hypothetical protein n=1 Tax=Pantanalinema sp. GBBB05 TaxID=2604139 RepID=UPI001D8973D3|nr:hypothetical protein [Pantanalinema sp. GBBB05]
MNLFNKQFIAEMLLELIMVMAPTTLDYLGAAGEFVLMLHPLSNLTCDIDRNSRENVLPLCLRQPGMAIA